MKYKGEMSALMDGWKKVIWIETSRPILSLYARHHLTSGVRKLCIAIYIVNLI